MPKQEYPMWVYDADGKSALVSTPEQHAKLAEAGWQEDPDTAAGNPKPDADRPADAPWGGAPAAVKAAAAPKVEYPMFLYHSTKPAVLVQHAAQHAALGDGWYESPEEAAGGSTPEIPSTPPAAPNESTPLDVGKMSVAEAELYVDTIGLEELGRVAEVEEKGKNRVGVKKAIEARLEKLAAEPVTLTPVPPAAD